MIDQTAIITIATQSLTRKLAWIQAGIASFAVVVCAVAAFLVAPELKAHRSEVSSPLANTTTPAVLSVKPLGALPVGHEDRDQAAARASGNGLEPVLVSLNVKPASSDAIAFAVAMAKQFCSDGNPSQARMVLGYTKASYPNLYQQTIAQQNLTAACLPTAGDVKIGDGFRRTVSPRSPLDEQVADSSGDGTSAAEAVARPAEQASESQRPAPVARPAPPPMPRPLPQVPK